MEKQGKFQGAGRGSACRLAGALILSASGLAGEALNERPFVEESGLLVIEAESFARKTESVFASYKTPHRWLRSDEVEGASGGAYMEVWPDERPEGDHEGTNSPRDNSGASLQYPIVVKHPGVYKVWVRGYCMGGESNGLHVGVNGQLAGREAGASNMSGFRPKLNWNWENGRKENCVQPATLELEAGRHTLYVWNRDDGFRFDKMALVLGDEKPEAMGPAESRRGETKN